MEGYLIIAAYQQKFLEMASNLALSIRLKDDRPIAIAVKDIKVDPGSKRIFDHIIEIPHEKSRKAHLNKFIMNELTPFSKTMYIDADCLMVKDDISIIWKKLKKYNFTVQGTKVEYGNHRGIDVLNVKDKLGIPYFVKSNSGLIYFDKTKKTKKVFEKLNWYLLKDEKILRVPFRGQIKDETYIGAVMGHLELEPFPVVFRHYFQLKQWMQCVSARYCAEIDVLKGKSKITFRDGHTDSPTVAHFVGFVGKRQLYLRESNRLRKEFGFSKNKILC